MAESDARADAVKRIKAKRRFQQQLIIYVLVNVLLWGIWLFSGADDFPWPLFVTVFWGIGMLTQGWIVYRGETTISEAEIEREMKKDPGTT